jgi:hypothetical protein
MTIADAHSSCATDSEMSSLAVVDGSTRGYPIPQLAAIVLIREASREQDQYFLTKEY